MNRNGENSEQNKESPISFSLQLELMGAVLGMIADALGTWAILEAMEEEKAAEEEETQAQNGLDGQLRKMQAQIDQLTKELADVKSSQFNNQRPSRRDT